MGKPWTWGRPGSSQSRVRSEVQVRGYSWFRMPDASRMALAEPELFVHRLCGRFPSRVETWDDRGTGSEPFRSTTLDGQTFPICRS